MNPIVFRSANDDIVRASHIPLPPSIPGGFLEASYHFYSHQDPSVSMQEIEAVLEEFGVDFEPVRAKYKFKCVTYKNGASIPFVVSIFSADKDQTYAIEFQRRAGNVIHFCELYRRIRAKLASMGLGDQTHYTQSSFSSSFTSSSSLPALPLPLSLPSIESSSFSPSSELKTLELEGQEFNNNLSYEEVREALLPLLSMASSMCVDIKSQAICTLSQLTENAPPQVQRAIISEGGLLHLLEAISNDNVDVHRCGLAGVANLMKGQPELCEQVAPHLIPILLQRAHSSVVEVQRQSTLALVNIVNLLDPKFFQSNSNLASTIVNQLRDVSSDKTVRGNHTIITQRLSKLTTAF